MEDCLDLLVKFKKYYDKPPELTDYKAERQQQKQDLAKERKVAENLKPQQTEQACQGITANDDEEEELHELMKLMLSRNKKNQTLENSFQALAILKLKWHRRQRGSRRKEPRSSAANVANLKKDTHANLQRQPNAKNMQWASSMFLVQRCFGQ